MCVFVTLMTNVLLHTITHKTSYCTTLLYIFYSSLFVFYKFKRMFKNKVFFFRSFPLNEVKEVKVDLQLKEVKVDLQLSCEASVLNYYQQAHSMMHELWLLPRWNNKQQYHTLVPLSGQHLVRFKKIVSRIAIFCWNFFVNSNYVEQLHKIKVYIKTPLPIVSA